VIKKLLRLAGVVSLLVTILWLTREHLLPTPRVADDPKPHYRSTPPPPPDPDDLTVIKGIGPVYAARLNEAGVQTYRGLSEIDAGTIADSVGTTPEAVANWIAQAKAKLN
jgi:predicted flap endonuclease-1-like 5' DNA nuclease